MISKNEYFAFLPSFWTNSLSDFPILGSEFRIIDLDKNFIKFIESDSIILEDDVFSLESSFDDSNCYSSDNDCEKEKSKVDLKPSILFPEIHRNIQNAISFLGGCVVPKLNWTVPTVLRKIFSLISTNFLRIRPGFLQIHSNVLL